ncbi:MAG: hypothetical protein WAS23_01120, partial [Dokdonella sp.]|uniref:hypothetical protein n=1 Tax=Dokdonella sp. TaxID=2291710 RepID=UPI003BB1F363
GMAFLAAGTRGAGRIADSGGASALLAVRRTGAFTGDGADGAAFGETGAVLRTAGLRTGAGSVSAGLARRAGVSLEGGCSLMASV